MAWPYLEDMIKVVVSINMFNKDTKNILYVKDETGTGVTSAKLTAAANAVHAALFLDWRVFASTDVQVTGVEAIDWTVPGGMSKQTTGTMPFTGNNVGDAVSNNVCLVTSHRSNYTGRSNRGRTYLGGISEGAVTGNIVLAAVIDAMMDFWDYLDVTLDTETMRQVIYSLYSNGAPRVTPVPRIITSRQINSRVDTQRRRLPK